MPKRSLTITMTQDSVKQHSVLYRSADRKLPNIYVGKTCFAKPITGPFPQNIDVTLTFEDVEVSKQ